MRFGFVTCVQLGLSCMEEIERLGGHLDLLITLEDDQAVQKSGRVWLDDFHKRHGGTLVKSRSVNDPKVIDAVRAHAIDWLFIIGWSQIAGPELLSAPSRGVLGMHPTLLPEGRGRAPIPWAIIKGLRRTGVTLFKLDEGVDTGPILAQEVLELSSTETATSLYRRANEAHTRLIRRIWHDLCADRIQMTPQADEHASVWPQRRPEDGEITPEMTVDEVDRLVRGLTEPYPGAFVRLGEQLIVIDAGRPNPGSATVSGSGHVVLRQADGFYLVDRLR